MMENRPAMIRTHGLTHIALAVRDVNRSSRFYGQVFGAVEVCRKDGFVQIDPGTWAKTVNVYNLDSVHEHHADLLYERWCRKQ